MPITAPVNADEPEGSDIPELSGPGGLFEKIRTHTETADGRGLVFQRLMKKFLTDDPLFAARFSQVRRGYLDVGTPVGKLDAGYWGHIKREPVVVES
jgi:hypothetical protein